MLKSPDEMLAPHTNSLKSTLTEENKLMRLAYCLDKQMLNGLFSEMNEKIHVNEKCFLIRKRMDGTTLLKVRPLCTGM